MEHSNTGHFANAAVQIVDITQEVIRDYFEENTIVESTDVRLDDLPRPQQVPRLRSLKSTAYSESNAGASASPVAPSSIDFGVPSVTVQTVGDLFPSPPTSDSTFEDGIFLPGSQYQELHATLRNRILHTARSTANSRIGSPEAEDSLQHLPCEPQLTPLDDDDESRRLAQLSPEHEYYLWQNWIGEVASWMDKFDNHRHFELVLPMLAKTNPHLKYSLLALSARQLERKKQSSDNSCSLALYQHAIHLLSPLLHRRTTVELASCVVLAVLEMMSCSPKAWKRHLDGCAALIQALGISGSGGSPLQQALFWVFARMDVCGALISSEKTLIPVTKWMGGGEIVADTAIFNESESTGHFDMYANHMVYLCGQAIDLLCTSGMWEQRHIRRSNVLDVLDYTSDWTQLFDFIEAWYLNQPDEMKPLLFIPPQPEHRGGPFATLLFGNPPAVSGNQLYHTAALLMLKYKPPQVRFARKPKSILWHARQICSISISNHHHGCWTNSIQPLWLAGLHMSHPSEHAAILEIYERIERELGWSTKWRQDDLKDFWGNFDE